MATNQTAEDLHLETLEADEEYWVLLDQLEADLPCSREWDNTVGGDEG